MKYIYDIRICHGQNTFMIYKLIHVYVNTLTLQLVFMTQYDLLFLDVDSVV